MRHSMDYRRPAPPSSTSAKVSANSHCSGQAYRSSVADAASISKSSQISNHRIKGGTPGKGIINNDGSSQEKTDINDRSQDSIFCYDICPPRTGSVPKLNAPLHVKIKELRKENKRNMVGVCIMVLRPGMLLLKHYISFNDQVKVVKKCRELGLGPGGFYLPGYQDGAKLNLKMMCLGKNWEFIW